MAQKSNIPIKNVYYMLCYAFLLPKNFAYEDMATETFDNIHNFFAMILARGIGYVTKRGLHRDYQEQVDDLSLVHGKIDLRGTMQNQIRHRKLITCRYDDLSEDTLPNRILKSTILLLLKAKDVKEKYKKLLRKELFYFSRVQETDLRQVPWGHFAIPRNNRVYEMVLTLCHLLTENSLLTTEKGNHHLPSFDIEDRYLAHLYEKFLLGYFDVEYASHISGFSSKASQIAWNVTDGKQSFLPIMQSDVTLTDSSHKRVLIMDAKFYGKTMQSYYNKRTYHSGNMYQIFTYVINKAAPLPADWTVSGMLLYAKTKEDVVPDDKLDIYGHHFAIQTLDLNQDFSNIRKQLDEIFQDYFPELST